MKSLKRAKSGVGPTLYQECNERTERMSSDLYNLFSAILSCSHFLHSQNVVLIYLVLSQNDRLLRVTALHSTLTVANW